LLTIAINIFRLQIRRFTEKQWKIRVESLYWACYYMGNYG